jgi:hypothetical protein
LKEDKHMGGANTNQGGGQTENSAVPSGNVQPTSTATIPLTFTPEQVQKAVSDALARAGREARALETRKAGLDAREQAVREAEAHSEAEARKALEGKPDELSLFDRRRAVEAEAAEVAAERKAVEAERAAHAGELRQAAALRFEMAVINLAGETGVDAGTLKDTGINDMETLKRVAALLPRKGQAITPDSGKTAGGEDLSKLSPGEKIARGLRNLK